jgi:hypothetical protein
VVRKPEAKPPLGGVKHKLKDNIGLNLREINAYVYC